MMDTQNKRREKISNADAKEGETLLSEGVKKALIGGVLASCIALVGQWMVGQIYNGYEARKLLETLIPSAHWLCGSIVTASATILALMLTMLSITRQTDTDFDDDFFRRVKRIGMLTTIALSGAILVLLFLSIPLQESDGLPGSWYEGIYYSLISALALLSGLVVSIVLMLYNTITGLIEVVRPEANDDEEDVADVES